MGVLAISLCAFGSISQAVKVNGSLDMDSFSPIYLVSVLCCDILFLAQSIMLRVWSLITFRALALLYSSYMATMYVYLGSRRDARRARAIPTTTMP